MLKLITFLYGKPCKNDGSFKTKYFRKLCVFREFEIFLLLTGALILQSTKMDQ